MATQRVAEEAKRYLGCDELPGAQLENEGSAAQALQHWEFRLFFQVRAARAARRPPSGFPRGRLAGPTAHCHAVPGAAVLCRGGRGAAQDLMTPLLLQGLRARMTGLTLGLLEDTGWYLPRWAFAQPFAGRPPSGCDLPTAACANFQARNPGQYYCQVRGQAGGWLKVWERWRGTQGGAIAG